MKSKYFKNLAKGLVVAGAAFALVNCGDAADQVNNAVGVSDLCQEEIIQALQLHIQDRNSWPSS